MADQPNIAVRVSPNIKKRLLELMKVYGCSMSEIHRAALLAGIENLEKVKSSVLMRAAIKLESHLEPSAATRDELRKLSKALDKAQAEKIPLFDQDLALE